MTTREQKEIDNYINNSQIAWRGLFNVRTYAMSLLSDAQNIPEPNEKNKLINQAKYVIGKHLADKENNI